MKRKWLNLGVALAAAWFAPSPSQAQVTVGNYTLSGSAEAGSFLNPQPATNAAKYREYQDLAQQLLAPELKFLLQDREERVFADFHALNVAQTNELYDLHFGVYGLLDIDAQWQEIPRFLSDGVARSPYQQSAGNFSLKSLPAAPAAGTSAGSNLSTWLNSNARPLSLSLLEGIANLNIRYTPTTRWTYSAYLNYLNQSGDSPYGEIFGPNPGSYNETELFQPIQYDTYNYGTGVQYADGTWLFGIQYEGSIFKNQYADLMWQNPNSWQEMTGPGGSCVNSATYPGSTGGSGPCSGQDYVNPPNQAHTIVLTAGRTLPLDTQLMGNFSYGWWLQNAPFIPYTTNTALPKQALPRNSLGGDVSPMYANFTVVSRPLTKLRLKATYNYFDYSNHDPAITFAGVNSLNDVASLWTATAYPFSFSTQTINSQVSYELGDNLVASLIGNINTYHNDGMMVLQQDMTSYGPVIDWTPYEWLELRGSYQHSFRDSPGYNNDRATLVNQNGGTAEFSQLLRFDEATVQVDQFSLYGDVQPFNDSKMVQWLQNFTIYAEMDYDNYFYPSSSYGIQNWSDYTPSIGINWTPLKNVNIYGDWSWTATDWSLQSFQRQSGGVNQPNCPSNPESQTPAACPGQTWSSYGRQQGNDIDFGFDIAFPTNRVVPWLTQTSHLRLQYNYTVTTDLTHANGDAALGGATDFPNVGSRFNELIVTYAYPIKDNMIFTIGYYFSNFGENDFGYDRLMPWMASSPQSMFLGNSNWTPFTGNAAYVTMKYAF